MKHVKNFQELNVTGFNMLVIFGAAALLKILYNIIKRKAITKGISNRDFDKLMYITKQYTSSRKLIGDIIDNDKFTQIVYEYGNADNMISIRIYWDEMKLKFKWDFEMPVFPYVKYADDTEIEVSITPEDVEKLRNIVDELKKEDLSS